MEQINMIWKEIRKMLDQSEAKESESECEKEDHGGRWKEFEERVAALEADSCRTGEIRVTSLEKAIGDLHIKIENMPAGGGSSFDEESFMIRYRKDLDLKANKSDLEHTRTDFGMWCNKYQKELERKLNRDELANFEQRLIEILSQSFADKVQNDKDHAKIFKKLQKLWGLVNS